MQQRNAVPFIHLHVHSPYSYLDGASDIETLVRQAASFGMPALAMTDHNSVAASVKFTESCLAYGLKPILGAELTLEDDTHLTLLAQDRGGYAHLCELISAGFAFGGRLSPRTPWSALDGRAAGLIALSGCRKGFVPALIRAHRHQEAKREAERLRDLVGSENFFLELQRDFTPDALRVARELVQLSEHLGVGVVATNNVHYACASDAVAHEVLRCIGTGSTVEDVHPLRPLNNERFLKSQGEMAKLFAWCPQALANTLRIAERCSAALPLGEDVTPRYAVPEGHTDAASYLRHLTYKGARARYRPLRDVVVARIEHELKVIEQLGFADYFLMAWRLVRWTRSQGIRCTGRGSAADSCVAYCLFLTDVDVIVRDLPFVRFLTEGKTPDIDLDFPSTRRDEVFQHIIDSYGEEHVGMVCTFHTYHAKGAVRDVGKALSLPSEILEWFSGHLASFIHADELEGAFERYPELKRFGHLRERFRLLFELCARISEFPRHMGSHSSGIVISRVPLATLAPLSPSARGLTQIWTLDKDDAETVGAIKLDVLSLRMLSAVEDAEAQIAQSNPTFRYDRIPHDDRETYRLIRSGGAVAVFQLQSAAQLALATRLQPEYFEDLVASVALIRPGPVRGDAVPRFVRARNGRAAPRYLHPALVPCLAKSFGVILYQEQAIQVIAAMTGISEAGADKVRKSLAKHARRNTMQEVRDWFVQASCNHHPDFDEARANLLFDQLEGWSGYGFTEGHAASFGLTAYRTAYLATHHAAELIAGEMSNQPMGYYSNNTMAAEARRRGVAIRPVDINLSRDKCVVERVEDETEKQPDGIRLGLKLVEGLRERDREEMLNAREAGAFASLLDFCLRVPLHRDALENLILCGAFDRLHEHRRGLLWRLEETLSLALIYRASGGADAAHRFDFGSVAHVSTPCAWDIADFDPWEAFMWTWRLTGVTAEAHVFAHLRERLAERGVMSTHEAFKKSHGTRVTVAGLNIVPHRPHSKNGNPLLFTTLEDETGMLQCICVGEAIDPCTPVFLSSLAVVVRGVVERQGTGAHLRVEKAKSLRLQEYVGDRTRELTVSPPTRRTYPGTRLAAPSV